MRKLRIKNWDEYQHYKDRDPSWIKLHVRILSSEDWVMLDDASKLLAIVCMVLAAGRKGDVPDNPDYIKRVAFLNKRPNLKPLIECGFLEILQASDTERKQPQADDTDHAGSQASAPREEERREENIDDKSFEAFWKAYPRKADKGHARKTFSSVLRSTRATAQELVSGAERYAKERSGEPQKFTKHATTWLNGECWKDESDQTHKLDEIDHTALWLLRLESWRAEGVWETKWGPKPGEAGCLAPQELLSEAA